MSYLESLIAGYTAGCSAPLPGSLAALRAALPMASSPAERGRCLGSIAVLIARDAYTPVVDPLAADIPPALTVSQG